MDEQYYNCVYELCSYVDMTKKVEDMTDESLNEADDIGQRESLSIAVFTIKEVREGKDSDKGWGRLKSGAGWISLGYCQKI